MKGLKNFISYNYYDPQDIFNFKNSKVSIRDEDIMNE